MLDSIRRARPMFVVNTGDIVYGREGTGERTLRGMWSAYRRALDVLPMPVYHAPGNHDIFDATSGRVWDELVGERHYAVDTLGIRLIVLDSETEPGRVGDEQFSWLRERLATLGGRTAFVVVHRPLFPVDAHIGTSLDRHPSDRDRLHALFVEHRDSIGAVFLGHEHQYHDETRDGVRYVVTGGGGAPLYVPPELGGFYHFVEVRHDRRNRTELAVHRLSDRRPGPAVVPHLEDGVVESFDSLRLVSAWDPSARLSSTFDQTMHGRRALRVDIDPSRQQWPTVTIDLGTAPALGVGDSVSLHLWCPAESASAIDASLAVEPTNRPAARLAPLRPGWNRLSDVVTVADGSAALRAALTLGIDAGAARTFVVVDHVHATKRDGRTVVQESFERAPFWSIWNDAVRSMVVSTADGRGLALSDGAESRRGARLFARLDPAWDLRAVDSLAIDIDAAQAAAMQVILGAGGERHVASEHMLRPGMNRVRLATRSVHDAGDLAGVESIELHFPRADTRTRRFVVHEIRLIERRSR
jgi:hypothetical protein